MSESDRVPRAQKTTSASIPDGVAKGIVGFALGAGVTFLAMHFYGPREKVEFTPPPANMAMPTVPSGPSGGGGGAGKRDLTALVGRLELLSRENLDLQIEIGKDQAAKIAAELAELGAAKTLTADEAQSRLHELESLLTPAQKETLDLVSLGTADGDGPGGAAPGENPFTQQANEKRLNDLLGRLRSANAESDSDTQ